MDLRKLPVGLEDGESSGLRRDEEEERSEDGTSLVHILNVSSGSTSDVISSASVDSGFSPGLDVSAVNASAFTLSEFDGVQGCKDNVRVVSNHDHLAISVDSGMDVPFVSVSNGAVFTTKRTRAMATSESDFVSDLSQVEILSGGDSDCGAIDAQDGTHIVQKDKTTQKRRCGWPKGKKRRLVLRDDNAPKPPITGYVWFLNEQREIERKNNPNLSFPEITKILGGKWSKLLAVDKQKYLDEADKDKERYRRELQEYHQTETYQSYLKKLDDKQGDPGKLRSFTNTTTEIELVEVEDDLYCKTCHQYFNSLHNKREHMLGRKHLQEVSNKVREETQQSEEQEEQYPGLNVPIFTEEFMTYSREKDSELREIRKAVTDMEEETRQLGEKIEETKSILEKLEEEKEDQQNANMALQHHLEAVRSLLTEHFSLLSLPGTNETPTLESIDRYMVKLHRTLLENSENDEDTLISTVREIISRLGSAVQPDGAA